MNLSEIKDTLRRYKIGEISEKSVINSLKQLSTEKLGFAHIDHHRSVRKGFPEVIFCQGKTNEQIKAIAGAILKRNKILLATRATEDNYEYIRKDIPDLVYYPDARIITTKNAVAAAGKKRNMILVVSAGTSDIPVAEEAAVTARVLGNMVKCIHDIGVAGIHRLLEYMNDFQKARVIIVVAGMEGALASAVGGLVDKPVIAVPTSVGYGASFGGIAALFAMLNSCASGVTVVNIDNGFGAGYAASLIVQSD
ncbi:1-(5-phosphoribosyl)-5-amino-4-imidazole-carboxylate carboxylase [bacterium SM23_31]|nr:MAG: 1-(5-phosphoribosyl)-5-amino-4-imidazole-carboxylate carboxylase [bacterium SM23_31]